VRLLEYMLILFLVIVVFVPAFAFIYSPAYFPPRECPEYECPTVECPECPPCPTCPPCECPPCPECPRLTGYIVDMPQGFMEWWWEDSYIFGEVVYALDLHEISGYKYILLVRLPRGRIEYAEWTNWETFDRGLVRFYAYNATHSYAETKRISGEFYIVGWYTLSEYEQYYKIKLHIFVVREDTTIHDILR
jgi:hypothetical protein